MPARDNVVHVGVVLGEVVLAGGALDAIPVEGLADQAARRRRAGARACGGGRRRRRPARPRRRPRRTAAPGRARELGGARLGSSPPQPDCEHEQGRQERGEGAPHRRASRRAAHGRRARAAPAAPSQPPALPRNAPGSARSLGACATAAGSARPPGRSCGPTRVPRSSWAELRSAASWAPGGRSSCTKSRETAGSAGWGNGSYSPAPPWAAADPAQATQSATPLNNPATAPHDRADDTHGSCGRTPAIAPARRHGARRSSALEALLALLGAGLGAAGRRGARAGARARAAAAAAGGGPREPLGCARGGARARDRRGERGADHDGERRASS